MTNTYEITVGGKRYTATPNFNGQRWQIWGYESMQHRPAVLYEDDSHEAVMAWLRRQSCGIHA